MLIASQGNPIIGALHFGSSDVIGTVEMFFDSYENMSDGNVKTSLFQAGIGMLGITGYTGAVSRAIPRGFSNLPQFEKAGLELVDALKKSGLEFSEAGVRGSAITNVSSKGGGFRMTATDGLPASDIDVYIHLSEDIGIKANGYGMIHPNKIMKKYPLLKEWSTKWSGILNREITPALFKPNTLTDNQVIKFIQ